MPGVCARTYGQRGLRVRLEDAELINDPETILIETLMCLVAMTGRDRMRRSLKYSGLEVRT
jgi:hypothetical protein